MQENRSGNPAVILVVDDEAHIVRVVAFKLRSAGFEVIEAFDRLREENAQLRRKLAESGGREEAPVPASPFR